MIKKNIYSLALISTLAFGNPLPPPPPSGYPVYDAANAANNTSMIANMVESIEKYETMISKAQEQIRTLGGISDIMNKATNFINNTNLTIANPLDLIKTLDEELKRIKRSGERLVQTFREYDLRDHIKSKRLQRRCPWLRMELVNPKSMKMFFTDKGEDSPIMKDAKALFKVLTDEGYSNLSSLAGSLSGRALGEFMCEKAIEEEQTKRIEQTQAEVKRAILEGNKKLALEKRKQLIKEIQEFSQKRNERERERWQPLVNRNQQFIEQMGVVDSSYNTKEKKYCQEGSNEEIGSFCYPVLLRSDEISDRLNKEYESFQKNLVSAGTNQDALAKAYADYQQKTSPLVLEYLRNIAESLNFLNTTTSFYSSLFAEDYKKRYSTEEKYDKINNDSFLTEDKVLAEVPMGINKAKEVAKDQYGFPTMTTSNTEETRGRAKNEYGL